MHKKQHTSVAECESGGQGSICLSGYQDISVQAVPAIVGLCSGAVVQGFKAVGVKSVHLHINFHVTRLHHRINFHVT
ncbi:hypothetical protein C5167_021345 [Papaver somniferum]|uniref:Uncharacterized protein n=1 Tax=Papaver somniferum TaxID=3469 RepID=A0A4Y7IXP0_PAPSO|nr:hypothetical protein C5167_021345 [Papaver somniferum]